MLIEAGFDIAFECPAQTPMLLQLSVHPSRDADLLTPDNTLTPDAAKILQGDVYGWFERIERGLYALTSSGRTALVTWADHVSAEASARFGGAPTPERMV